MQHYFTHNGKAIEALNSRVTCGICIKLIKKCVGQTHGRVYAATGSEIVISPCQNAPFQC